MADPERLRIAMPPPEASADAGGACAASDDALMRLAAEGDVDAFSTLVRRHQRAVRSFCGRMLGSAARGEDVAQEVFLELWRSAHRYEPRGRFRALLFTAARNRCLGTLRHRPAEATLDAPTPTAPADQLDLLLAAERRRRLDALVSRLKPAMREALLLRFTADLDYREIAEVTRRSEETVRSRVFLGLRRLRAWLERSSEKEPG